MIDIAVNDLQKEYQVGQPVLTGLTFQVDTGERVGILGKNGAGKTTLFRILTGQEEADGGTVTLAPGKRLGLISQIPRLPRWVHCGGRAAHRLRRPEGDGGGRCRPSLPSCYRRPGPAGPV